MRICRFRTRFIGTFAAVFLAACVPSAVSQDARDGLYDGASGDAIVVDEGTGIDGAAGDARITDTNSDAGAIGHRDVGGADRITPDRFALDRGARQVEAGVDAGAGVDVESWLCEVDPDGDEYGLGTRCRGRDCAPQNSAIHPGVAEICDRLDNDCDGLVDQDLQCPAPLPKIWVFVLAGQSNMVGLGQVAELGANTDLFPASLRAGIPNVGIYLEDSVHQNPNQNGTMRWLDLNTNGGFGVDQNYFGPELGFGKRMHELWPERQIRILKVAEGGTNLFSDWAARTGRLYSLLLDTVSQQFDTLGQRERIELVGFIWMQGESDAYGDPANAYLANLRNFVAALREDLGQPLLPMSLGLIAPQGGWPEADKVRNATAALAQQIGPINTVETNDLSMRPGDQAHYDTRSQLLLGQRFADAIHALLPAQWHSMADFSSAQGDAQWRYQGWLSDGSSEPMVFDTTQGRWAGSEMGLLIMPGEMHPGATSQAQLVWRAPYGGRIRVDIEASAASNVGGDGTWVDLDDDGFLRWGPVAVGNHESVQQSFTLDVEQGRELKFRTGAGPAHDASYDTTAWRIGIDMIQVDK